jgi:hypothetical protein
MVCSLVFCAALLASTGGTVDQADPWFTLVGDRLEPQGDLIEVRPEPTNLGERVLLDLRVSRSHVRSSFKGQKYRSYYAKVVVNCTARQAWYLSLSYHAQPQWQGPPVGTESYEEGQAPVLFKDVPRQPYKRLIHAACSTRAAAKDGV